MKIAKDKQYHLVAGFLIALLTGWVNPFAGLTLVVLAGVGKEVYDMYVPNHTVDVWDAIYTVVGGLPPLLVYFVVLN